MVGVDMILGLGTLSLLSQEQRSALRTHKIHCLYQAEKQNARGMILDPWKTNVDLGVIRPLAMEWTCYTRVLCGSGIHLSSGEDRLLWMGGDQSGTLTTKNVYNAIAAKMWTQQLGAYSKEGGGSGRVDALYASGKWNPSLTCLLTVVSPISFGGSYTDTPI